MSKSKMSAVLSCSSTAGIPEVWASPTPLTYHKIIPAALWKFSAFANRREYICMQAEEFPLLLLFPII